MPQREAIFNQITENALISRVITDYFDEVVLIDCGTGCVMNVSDRIAGEQRNNKKYAVLLYDVQVKKTITDNVADSERPAIEKALLLSVVMEELKHKDSYCVEFFTIAQDRNTPVYEKITYKFLDERQDVILMLCEDISDVVSNENDPLTGLYNSSGFHNHVEKWIEENPGRRFRVQRYNIDRFRDINGVYGYELGNKLLRDFGLYMKKYNSADSFAAHLNADHFVRFCADDELTVEESYNHFTECFKNYDLSMPIKLHMGVYDLCEPNCDSFTMSYKALLALQSIKGSFSKKIAYYEKGMMAVEKEQQELLADIQRAIEEEQFEVWFQPQTDYAGQKIIGAEALIRWNHPRKGMLPPAVFIPLLEKSDYISIVDKFVFEKVCRYICRWKNEIWNGECIPVSVNLSRNDVYRKDLCEGLSNMIKRYGISPSKIHLEITESVYMENAERFAGILGRLRESGFKVELDDFGSGYSSLNFLKEINIDKLKLDKNFLSDDGDTRKGEIILSSVINMAKALDLPVIAEGVETKEQAEMLAGFGCSQMQGYYFSRPVPAAEYERMLRAEAQKRHEEH